MSNSNSTTPDRRRNSREVAEAVLLREHPEATGLAWIPRGTDTGALLELHHTVDGKTVPSGILIAPEPPPGRRYADLR